LMCCYDNVRSTKAAGPCYSTHAIALQNLQLAAMENAIAYRADCALTYHPLEPLQCPPPVACTYALHLTHLHCACFASTFASHFNGDDSDALHWAMQQQVGSLEAPVVSLMITLNIVGWDFVSQCSTSCKILAKTFVCL